jgi:hypothetical protein
VSLKDTEFPSVLLQHVASSRRRNCDTIQMDELDSCPLVRLFLSWGLVALCALWTLDILIPCKDPGWMPQEPRRKIKDSLAHIACTVQAQLHVLCNKCGIVLSSNHHTVVL